ncbi:hypothetical protein NW762_008310 [Fusarium torreyae]|uniref:Methyltransferase n=1 Tax=Fusarium torreyae TaxID=1237075 RepID=A0A9W8VFU0_9HYPO|nr:hypothetical protein NW762_008310 [Fusarium torreyae]
MTDPSVETTSLQGDTSSPMAHQPGEGNLQPGGHWTQQDLLDVDTDGDFDNDAASSTASISSSILKYRTINGRTYHSDRGGNQYCEIDDFARDWTFKNDSLDFVHTRWLIGSVTDWTALFKQAYKALKPGAWLESFEVNGYFESDDNTLPDESALAQWGVIFREGAKKLRSPASFAVVRDRLQKQAMEEAGFVSFEEKHIKIPTSGWPQDLDMKRIGQFTRAAIENDIEGAVGFMATQIGWSQDEIASYAAHLRKELRSNQHHSYYRANVVWAQKPEGS